MPRSAAAGRPRTDETFLLGIAAEGTRSKGEYWKSGFYRIAQQTGLPITLAFLDAPSRTVGWGPTFTPSGDVGADMDRLRAFFADKRGFKPELATVPRLRRRTGAESRFECRRGESNPHARRHTDLNRACLPVPPPRPERVEARSPVTDGCLEEVRPRAQAASPRSLRSLATWPVALTLYWASSILPFSSTTKVERITPLTFCRTASSRRSAPGAHHRLVRVGDQRDVERVLFAELGQLLRLVRGDADDLVARACSDASESLKSQACLVQPGVIAAG